MAPNIATTAAVAAAYDLTETVLTDPRNRSSEHYFDAPQLLGFTSLSLLLHGAAKTSLFGPPGPNAPSG